MSTVGSRIHNRRLELGISADDLASLLGKNRATIYRYESSEIENLPVSVIEPLANALNVSPAYLMGWLSSPPEAYWSNTFRDRLGEYLCNIDTTDAIDACLNIKRLQDIVDCVIPITLLDAYNISCEVGVSFFYLCGITDDEESKPTPVSESGLDETEKVLMRYVSDLTEDQKRMLLAQMQVMKESQRESLSFVVQK